MKSKRILITKEKGGVASTTTAVNLAYDLAQRGNRVLLVDMDTRGDCAPCLGLDATPDLHHIFEGAMGSGAWTPGDEVAARPDLWLVRTNVSSTLAAITLADSAQVSGVANLLKDMSAAYEYTIFDTSAASGALRRAAMQIADLMVIPTRLEALGMADIAALIEAYGKPLQVLILPVSMRRLNVHAYNLGALQEAYSSIEQGGAVAEAIPDRVTVIESHSAMQPVMEYAPACDASLAYGRFTDTVLATLDRLAVERVEEEVERTLHG